MPGALPRFASCTCVMHLMPAAEMRDRRTHLPLHAYHGDRSKQSIHADAMHETLAMSVPLFKRDLSSLTQDVRVLVYRSYLPVQVVFLRPSTWSRAGSRDLCGGAPREVVKGGDDALQSALRVGVCSKRGARSCILTGAHSKLPATKNKGVHTHAPHTRRE